MDLACSTTRSAPLCAVMTQLVQLQTANPLPCRPAGKLKVSIKCTWLKDAKIDMDALTEASFTTHKSNDGLERPAEQDEQVLFSKHEAMLLLYCFNVQSIRRCTC